ncbi:MAG: DUF2062 domain-containing protein [Acidobacteriaceae bacterium]|jgi:uncharacterized protein (DUF2062 family)|nr:DUF2062 domain-containing protein [Acidobacteriaceae bacterium]
MIHLTKSLIRRWLDTLLHIHDTPERTAAAFALGVFLGFSPFLGFHTIVAIALAFVLNLNRVAVLLGVYSNLPWIIGGYYTSTTMLGAAIVHKGLPSGFRERLVALFELSISTQAFWHGLADLLKPLLAPFIIGSLIGCTLLAAIAYPLALAFVRKRRHLAIIQHRHHDQKSES